jgi:hypothetical protein
MLLQLDRYIHTPIDRYMNDAQISLPEIPYGSARALAIRSGACDLLCTCTAGLSLIHSRDSSSSRSQIKFSAGQNWIEGNLNLSSQSLRNQPNN